MRKRDQPHDRYFRYMMEDVDVAKSFCLAYANPKVKAKIVWETFELYDTSLVGPNSQQLYADVVYRALTITGEESFIVLNHSTDVPFSAAGRCLCRGS